MALERQDLIRRIDQALGREAADLVIRNTRFLNLASGEIARGDIAICGDLIVGTYDQYRGKREINGSDLIVAPGFIDTHVHVESSCVTPGEFDRCVLPKGTTTAICDPHEIANVLGLEGLRYFLDSAEGLAMDLRVQLSSCVPATGLETSGATLLAADLVPLRDHPKVIGLAEFMNFPGIFAHDPAVLDKLCTFDGWHIDGHAPLVSGHELNAYCACHIRNCHESTGLEEAREKMRKGMQVLIRDGSVSRDVAALAPLIDEFNTPFISFCTDDRNPLDIAEAGHMDHLIRSAIAAGAPPVAVYRAATWSAAQSFGLRDRGLVAPGYRADLVLLNDLESCSVQQVIAGGRIVGEDIFENRRLIAPVGRNSVRLDKVEASTFAVPSPGPGGPVIGVIANSIITEHLNMTLPYRNGCRQADPENDVLKVCVFNRHGGPKRVGRGFVRGFGFTEGAIASSVGHDSHNVIVIGTDDRDMAVAVNHLIDIGGGFVVVKNGQVLADLPLPLAGLISDRPHDEVRERLHQLRAAAGGIGCVLEEPFLQMAFLPLPVIPHLKITDHGLVDVDNFRLVA